MIPYLGIFRAAFSLLKNPIVLLAMGLAAAQVYGVYKAHQGAVAARAECDASWKAKLAEARAAEREKIQKALRAAMERQKDADRVLAEAREIAAKLKEGFRNAKDCNLDPSVIDRLRRIR